MKRKEINFAAVPKKMLLYIGLTIFSIINVIPFFWMISASFKMDNQVFHFPIDWIPDEPTLINYSDVVHKMPFLSYYFNSLKIAVACTIVQVLASALAAYAFAKIDFKFKNLIFSLFTATMMIPWHSIMIPQFMIVKELGLYDTHTALVLIQVFSAFGIFMLRQFFLGIPQELSEAARMDGASELRTFWQIILPQAKPAIATLCIFVFMNMFNDYLAPLMYLNSTEKYTVQLGLKYFQSEYSVNYAAIMAGTVCALIPVIIVYLTCEKQITKSVTMTGIKG